MDSAKTNLKFPSLFDAKTSIFAPFFQKTQYPWEVHELLLSWLLQKKPAESLSFDSVHFENIETIFLEPGVKIAPGAYIQGPCYIGKGVTIGHCAYIRSGTFLAPGVHVGHCSEISRSIFFENAKAPHFNYIGDSIVGQNVNLGAHVTTANLRLDKKEVSFVIDNQRIFTKRKKFGALIGDGTSVGAGVVLNPGTILSKNSKIPPLTTLKGFT